MDWIRILLSRSAALFRSKKLDADLDEELHSHIDLAIEENRGRGMNEAQGGSLLLLWVAAAISAIMPARRAASADPMRALRTE